ncbi:MAG: hypothetical protein ABL856_12530 [Gallionella sp.]
MSKLSELFATLKEKFVNDPAALAEVEAQERAEVEAQERAELDAEQAAADEAAQVEAKAVEEAQTAALDPMRPHPRFATLCEEYDKRKAKEHAAQVA